MSLTDHLQETSQALELTKSIQDRALDIYDQERAEVLGALLRELNDLEAELEDVQQEMLQLL